MPWLGPMNIIFSSPFLYAQQHWIYFFRFFVFVSEGGRLQEELKYVESKLGRGAGSTSELIIQTPRDDGSILTPEALLAHLDVIKAASKVVVEKHDV